MVNFLLLLMIPLLVGHYTLSAAWRKAYIPRNYGSPKHSRRTNSEINDIPNLLAEKDQTTSKDDNSMNSTKHKGRSKGNSTASKDFIPVCYSKSRNMTLEAGEAFPSEQGECRLHKCVGSRIKNGKPKTRFTVSSCPEMEFDGDSSCYIGPPKAWLPFPQCCRHVVCIETRRTVIMPNSPHQVLPILPGEYLYLLNMHG